MNTYYLTPSQTVQLTPSLLLNRQASPSLYYPQSNQQQPLSHQQVQQIYHNKGIGGLSTLNQKDNSNYKGMGRLNFPNGDMYEGNFRSGKMEGKGVLFTARGDRYEGNFKNGFKHGKGKIVYRNGISSYEGDWLYNKIEGQGVMVDDLNNRYEGEFKDNMKNGMGKCYYENGMRFDGFWNKNIPEKGELFMKNGNYYEGEWRDDRFSGVGTIRFSNGDIYEGEWKENLPHRYGKMLYRNGRVYNGEWFMYKKQGQGVMNYPNGDQYEGEWSNDLRDGFGLLRFAKGDQYEGEWTSDKMGGKGILTHPDGSSYEGLWENGQKLDQQGIFKYSNGNVAIRSNYNINEKQSLIVSNAIAHQPHKFIEYQQTLPGESASSNFRPRPLPQASFRRIGNSDGGDSLNRSLSQAQHNKNSYGPPQVFLPNMRATPEIKPRSMSNIRQTNIGKNVQQNLHSPQVDQYRQQQNKANEGDLNNSYADQAYIGLSMIPTRPDFE